MNKVKLTIAVDVDDTIADLLGAWINAYNKGENESVVPEDIFDWDLNKALRELMRQRLVRTAPDASGTDIERAVNSLYVPDRIYTYLTPELYDHVLPIRGARGAVEKMRSAGHRVVFATSSTGASMPAKLHWLERWGFLTPQRFQPDYITVSDKALVRADVLIDDRVKNVTEFPGRAFIPTVPHNKAFDDSKWPRVVRIDSIADAPLHIDLLVKTL